MTELSAELGASNDPVDYRRSAALIGEPPGTSLRCLRFRSTHWLRNTTTGSTRVDRNAGRYAAASATTPRPAATAITVEASSRTTP